MNDLPLPCCNFCEPANPLVFTIEFPYHEYICMNCGSLFEFLGVRREHPTNELIAKYEVNVKRYQVERAERAEAAREAARAERMKKRSKI